MAFNQVLKQLAIVTLSALCIVRPASADADLAVCNTGSEVCLESCKRFNEGNARWSTCNNFCRTKSKDCMVTAEPVCNGSCEEPSDDSLPGAPTPSNELKYKTVGQEPKVDALTTKKARVRELEKNGDMLAAIREGNLTAIRRLIETQGLSPTYVYAYEYNAQTRQYEGRVARLRLGDIFNDTNSLRSDAAGIDRVVALFLELGMDVKATLVSSVPANDADNAIFKQERTAWGPSLTMMEKAKDRDARLKAFELTLQAGLVPNDDIAEWLFAELPQVCGRDRSKFAIQVVDLLIEHLGSSLQEHFWREGERGPETVSDVLDKSFAPPQAKNAYEKTQFALQDERWEQCALLSRRINRFLMQGE
ncbi:MAG: hypothetical protein H7Y02_04100 [Candidatus Obscuribacterales bacterium]|nr:hypothetical protein [Steroidobacteraceae bacterium]